MARTKRSRRTVPAMLVAALVALSVASTSVSGAAGDDRDSRSEPGVRGAAPVGATVSEPLDTSPGSSTDLRRLSNAKRRIVDGTWFPGAEGTESPSASRKKWQNRVPRKRMPRSVGKLYTLNDGLAIGECSAFTIRDPKFPKKRSFIVTAAHCLVDPKTKDWVNIAQFHPKYYGKRPKPFGRWDAKRMMVYDRWYKNKPGKWRFDIGVVRVERHKKRQVVDRVGGNRLAYGARPRDKRVRFIGYPAAGKYNGDFPYQCVGPARRYKKKKWMATMPCATRQGASGGPWFKRMRNRHTGVAYAALSRGTTSGKRFIIAPTFKKSLRRMTFKQRW